jgi:hypothetical protein
VIVGKELVLDMLMREEEHWLSQQLAKTAGASDALSKVILTLVQRVRALEEHNTDRDELAERKKSQSASLPNKLSLLQEGDADGDDGTKTLTGIT